MLTDQIELYGKGAKQKVFNIDYPIWNHDQSIPVVARPFRLDLITELIFCKHFGRPCHTLTSKINRFIMMYAVVLYKSFKIGYVEIVFKVALVFAAERFLLARKFDPPCRKSYSNLPFAVGFIADRTASAARNATMRHKNFVTARCDPPSFFLIIYWGWLTFDPFKTFSALHGFIETSIEAKLIPSFFVTTGSACLFSFKSGVRKECFVTARRDPPSFFVSILRDRLTVDPFEPIFYFCRLIIRFAKTQLFMNHSVATKTAATAAFYFAVAGKNFMAARGDPPSFFCITLWKQIAFYPFVSIYFFHGTIVIYLESFVIVSFGESARWACRNATYRSVTYIHFVTAGCYPTGFSMGIFGERLITDPFMSFCVFQVLVIFFGKSLAYYFTEPRKNKALLCVSGGYLGAPTKAKQGLEHKYKCVHQIVKICA